MANNQKQNHQPDNRRESKNQGTSNRGFASMDENRQRQIASKGGQSVPAEERSFSKDRSLASEAGRKGGESSHGGGRRSQHEESSYQSGAPSARRHQDTQDSEW